MACGWRWQRLVKSAEKMSSVNSCCMLAAALSAYLTPLLFAAAAAACVLVADTRKPASQAVDGARKSEQLFLPFGGGAW